MLTSATADLALLILSDSAKIQVERARRARRKRGRSDDVDARHAGEEGSPPDEEARLRAQPPEARLRDDEPLYDLDDVLEVSRRFEPVRYGEPRVVAPGITATFEDAGHILGSAVIVLDVEDAGRSRRLVFSGDLGRPDQLVTRVAAEGHDRAVAIPVGFDSVAVGGSRWGVGA